MTDRQTRAAAMRALQLLDLTNLNDDCTASDIDALCAKAATRFGAVAAVCIWPAFVRQAKGLTAGGPVKVATVVNFPQGTAPAPDVAEEARGAVADGTDEVDLVMPWPAFLAGDRDAAGTMIETVKAALAGRARLKVILETGELKEAEAIAEASRLAIEAGADFIKTSTGKTATSATPEAAEIMLRAIRESGKPVGFKPSGGIRTLADAGLYLPLADRIMGAEWARPETFRFGASGLLNALLAEFEGAAETRGSGSY